MNTEPPHALTAQAMPAAFAPDESSAYVLPSARPAAPYAAQLSIPPGLGYPFQLCRLSPGAPSWLHLDCQKLTLTGHAPAGRKSSYSFRLDLADASGNQQSYPLAISVSNAPAVVALGRMPAASSPEAVHSNQPLPAAQNMPRLTRRPQSVPVAVPAGDASDVTRETELSPTPMRRANYTPPADPDSAAAANLAEAGRGLIADGSAAAAYSGTTPASEPARSATANAAATAPSTNAPASTSTSTGATGNNQTTGSDDTPPQSGMYRYYFTFGDLLSKQDGSFSHSDLFLDFHADRSFLLPANYVNTQRPWYRPGINSYFDVRLTSVPAATQNCTQTPPSTTTTSTTTSSCTSGNSTTSGNLDTTTGAQVFLNSQKSASVGGGFYLPFMLPKWEIDKETYATFIAPIAKIGFQTTIDNLGQTQQTTTTAQQSVMSTVTSGVAPVGSSSTFYKNYSYGGRVGIYHFPAKVEDGQAPSIEHYLDISMGRFSNLPSAVCANTPSKNPPCGTTAATYVYQRQYRIALEGFFQVPATHGFSIGFSANVAQHVAGAHHYDFLPPDDLRFLFGYKFDVQYLVNILKKPAS